MLSLFDTARGAVVPFEPARPPRVSMYVCGPTVYGPPHLGHGRFALVFDVVRRYLAFSGYEVVHVSNVTDIDDKIIARAADEGRTEPEVAAEFEALWWETMDRLDVLRPTHAPHATAYVGEMVDLVRGLLDAGVAYRTEDGVYLEAEKADRYGLLARQPLDSLRAGARVEERTAKRSPVDFVLWKPARAGEPSWPAPWGDGRPGWHTECVVMSLDLLGEGFDLHGGGADLAFPHHENERAQADLAGRPFARHWMHNGFVEVGGEKMSKSLGNFSTIAELLEAADPRAYRLLVLRSHYRSPVDVTPAATDDASAALARLDAFSRRTRDLAGEADEAALDRFRAAMNDDLDTPAATAGLFDLVRRANAALDAGDEDGARPLAVAAETIADALGLHLATEAEAVPEAAAELARRRDAARVERDFTTADALRDELSAQGWIVEDSAEGTTLRRS